MLSLHVWSYAGMSPWFVIPNNSLCCSIFFEEKFSRATWQNTLVSVRNHPKFVFFLFLLPTCSEGYLNCLCFRAGSCGEHQCPDFCLCAEACCCNALAMSATRMYVMEKYDLGSDPCDFRLIRINNCIQLFACFCDIASAFNEDLRDCAK